MVKNTVICEHFFIPDLNFLNGTNANGLTHQQKLEDLNGNMLSLKRNEQFVIMVENLAWHREMPQLFLVD